MNQYEQIMERYRDQIKVEIKGATSFPAHLKFPLQLLKDLWDNHQKNDHYLSNKENYPELEEHGLPRNLELSTILVEDIFEYADLFLMDIKTIDKIEIKDEILSIDCIIEEL